MQNIRGKLHKLLEKDFVRSVGVLAGGTAFAQALSVLALPILTRLYTPADFSVLAVYTSALAMIAVVACLRLEIAVPMPERDEDAANILVLALTFSAVFSFATGIAIYLFPDRVIALLRQPAFSPYMWLLPIGVWLASSYAAFQFWASRKKRFLIIAKTRMMQAVGGSGTQLILGWAGIAPLGLLLGHMFSSGAGLLGLGRQAQKDILPCVGAINRSNLRRMLREYSRFPKYSTLDALANSVGIQLPVIIIAALAVGPDAGYLMLATRVMAAPMALIGGAVSQVYLSRAADELRSGTLDIFTADVLKGLIRTGFGPLLVVGIIAPTAFSIIFGKDWTRAGDLVAWMTPWFALQFLSSPISMVMHVTGRQRAMLLLTASGLCIRLGSMYLAFYAAKLYFAEAYAISGAVFYFICFCVFSCVAGISLKKMRLIVWRSLPYIAAWVLLGFMLKIALVEITQ